MTEPEYIPCCYMTCSAPSTWVRCVQFSGDHYFCDEHAKQEDNFGKTDSSHFFWKQYTWKQ